MESQITDEITRDPVLGPAVRRADEVLRDLFGSVRQPPVATWQPSSIKQADSAPSVELDLREHEDCLTRDYRVEELADERAFRHALFDHWGSLIMNAYGKSNQRLLEALRELRKEEERRELQVQGA
jgi:hypothetical protein